MIKKDEINTVEKLHAVLTKLINQGKGKYEVIVDNDGYYDPIDEVKVGGGVGEKEVIIIC